MLRCSILLLLLILLLPADASSSSGDAPMLDTSTTNNKKCVAVLVHVHAQQAREAAAVMLVRYFSVCVCDIHTYIHTYILVRYFSTQKVRCFSTCKVRYFAHQAREAAAYAYTSRAASVFVL
jgi:hypothetical protein